MKTMLAITKPRPRSGKPWPEGLELKERPVPQIKSAEEVRVRVRFAGICGTDVGIYQSKEALREELAQMEGKEVILGHEFCGEIDALGARAAEQLVQRLLARPYELPEIARLRKLVAGRRGEQLANHPEFLHWLREQFYVTAEMHITCGHCYACRTGQGHVCPNARIKGLQQDGAFAHFVLVPARNLILIRKPTIPPQVIAFMDAIGNAVHLCQSADLLGATLVVLGTGVQGLLATAVAHRSGAAHIITTDLSSPEREFTPQKLEETRFRLARLFGADACLDMAEPGARDRLREAVARFAEHGQADVVFETSGSPTAYQDALAVLRWGGTFCLLGIPTRPIEMDFGQQVILKGITLKGIIGRRIFDTWERMVPLLCSGLAELLYKSGFITHIFPLDRYQEAFAALQQGTGIKVLLRPENDW